MKMASDETSFDLLRSIIAEDVDAYVQLRKYIKNCDKFLKKPVDSSGCADAIKLLENNRPSNQMTEEMARDCLKDLFQPLIS